MTKTLRCAVTLAVLMCALPVRAQIPRVPPVPPVPPAAPVAPPPPPPTRAVDIDGFRHFDFDALTQLEFDALRQFDFDAFKIEMDAFKVDMDAWKVDFDAVKETLTPFAFDPPVNVALQTPAPMPPVRAPVSVYVDAKNSEGLYDQARGFIERDQYTRAVDAFDRVIAAGGDRVDAAMYWKAYSLSKVARTQDALATLADMQKRFGTSRWINDARSLEIEIKQAAGQAVSAEGQSNDEIRLLALQGMMRSDPDTTLPIVEKMLAGNASVRVKERALFVVSQSRTPRSREIIANVAKGSSNPDLQVRAISLLGQMSGTDTRQALADIYRGSANADVKRAVMRSLAGANAFEELSAIARSEKDPELRRAAIRYLATTNRPEAAETLRSIYQADATPETRRDVIRALSTNRSGAKALVDLARSEKNIELKTEIVRVLSNMRDPVARDYLLELLKQP
jgi:HEAT repeat protein